MVAVNLPTRRTGLLKTSGIARPAFDDVVPAEDYQRHKRHGCTFVPAVECVSGSDDWRAHTPITGRTRNNARKVRLVFFLDSE